MRSPWGNEAAICSHFHWTREYLLYGIAWVNIQLMLIDAPSVEYGTQGESADISDFESEEDLMAFLSAGEK